MPSKPVGLSAVGCRCLLPTRLHLYQYIICVKAIQKAVLCTSSPPSSLSLILSSPLRQPDLQRWQPSTPSFPSGCTQQPQRPGPAWSTAAAGSRGRCLGASSPRCRYRPLRARSTAGTEGRRCPGCREPPGVPRASRGPPGRLSAVHPPPPARFLAGAIFWPAQLRAALPAAKWPPCCGDPGDGRAEGARRPPSPPSACAKCSVCEL